MRRLLVASTRLVALAFLLAGVAARAQEPAPRPSPRPPPKLESPSGYVESIETPGDTGGVEDEVDAGAAQAEEAERTGETPRGLSRAQTQQVEQIVVRARKRDELLEETPISITALSETTLREAGITRVDEIQQLVPNLAFVTGRSGFDSRVRIRGIGPLEGGDPGVGIYVDGVYLPRAFGSVLNVVDIQQLEVLRGPQGTLFGKNTVGGAINITTIKPRDELEGFAYLRTGSFGTIDTRATLNVPVNVGVFEDKLFTRFSFASANSEGYAYNQLRDEYFSDQQGLWVLGSILYQPTDTIDVNIAGNWFEGHSRGKGGQCFAELDRAPNNIVQAVIIEPNYPDFFEQCARSQPFLFEADAATITNPVDYGMWGTVSWDAGDPGFLDQLDLKLIGSWREQSLRTREDIDMTATPLVIISALGGDEEFAGQPRESRVFNVEGQVNGTTLDGDLVFVTGVFAQWEKRGSGLATRGAAGTAADFAGGTTIEDTDQNDWDWAIFGQTTYDVTDWIGLTAGLRYTQEKKGVNRFTENAFAVTEETRVLLDAQGRVIFDAWTPMGSIQANAPEEWLDGTPIDFLMGYFTYARGFKGGGFNAAPSATRQVAQDLEPYQPEFLDSYEIGFKTMGFEDKLTFNTSFFIGKYEDIQVVTTTALPGANPNDLPVVERTIQNAAKATIKGMELEALARPIDGLELTGSVGLLDPIYNEYIGISDIDGTQLDRSGQTFNDVPEFTSFVSVQYSFAVDAPVPDWLNGWLTPRLEWYYQSETHINAGPELRGAIQPGYNLLHFRTSYDFWDDRAQFAFFIRNLTDQEYFREAQTIVNPFGVVVRYYEPPRMIGIEMSVRF